VTYQQWECYWPAAAKNPKSTQSNLDFSRFADETMKVVFSKTVKEVHWKNSRLVKGDITEEILRLEAIVRQGYRVCRRSVPRQDLH
jgi:dihydrofolate reductase